MYYALTSKFRTVKFSTQSHQSLYCVDDASWWLYTYMCVCGFSDTYELDCSSWDKGKGSKLGRETDPLNRCFSSDQSESNVPNASTVLLDTKLWEMAPRLQDQKLLVKLAIAYITALDSRYHRPVERDLLWSVSHTGPEYWHSGDGVLANINIARVVDWVKHNESIDDEMWYHIFVLTLQKSWR